MTTYDAAMLGVVVAGMIWGAVRGITWQVASIASLVLGYVVAFPVSAQLAPHFPGEPVVARALALLAAYACVAGGVFLAAWTIRTTLRRMQFEAFDRHLGMILGGLEGALIGVVATVFVVSLAPKYRDPILTSPTGKIVSAGLNATQRLLPAEIRDHLAPLWAGPVEAMAVGDPVPDEGRAPAESKGIGDEIQGLVEREGAKAGKAMADGFQKRVEQTGRAYERELERR